MKLLSADEAAKKPPNFLIDDLGERLASGPARFRIVVQLAGEGDKVDDATESGRTAGRSWSSGPWL